ncbi:protein mono-ADP-ribosyltransferase PARP12 isoform X1 [Polypterus senegalus]|uniref:protein mono-ADP-ribosyltransferase PARP12 isoform X1 n=1 Tax=Polypterus senegalus TaxID=55291 RepID=UPI0019629744|nr:protein mono-ADP-ribosyltransferase PARP12 isoform X1 [Polypterus senegalus]
MTAAAVTKLLCANNGAMGYDELRANVGGDAEIERTLADRQKFAVVTAADGTRRIIAKTSVKLCKAQSCQGCSGLHLCKFYLYGDCKFSRRKNGCRFCHDLHSENNSKVLRDNGLQDLNQKELCQLLLQNELTLLPPVCFSYNRGNGTCSEDGSCTRLHMCEQFLQGKPHSNCSKSHDFLSGEVLRVLEGRGLTPELISTIPNVYLNILSMKNSKGKLNEKNKTEICLFFVWKDCRHGQNCFQAHFSMPYQWQVQDGLEWSDLPDNENIEKEFCNPANTCSSGAPSINFYTMTQGKRKVRRLSTASSVEKPNLILTTRWIWYWEDEYGNWTDYGSTSASNNASTIKSEDLEKSYIEDSNATIQFKAGRQDYNLIFPEMIQVNHHYGTIRTVRRRPAFVSKQDVVKIRTSKKSPKIADLTTNFKAIPPHWDKTLIPETGYKVVKLLESSEEYTKIKNLFTNTMPGYTIVKIERIQNKSLWEVFQWQKEQMKKNKGGKPVNERQLFHGTDSEYVEAICKQNFDWRICGTHGTAYGKGSYFARDANYSHGYTGSSSRRTMFVARILVGDYVVGNSSYVRPPSKDGGDCNFYDSCVNNARNPSIFVVFEKHQVYPEYLIEYLENSWGNSYFASQRSYTTRQTSSSSSNSWQQNSTTMFSTTSPVHPKPTPQPQQKQDSCLVS